MLLVFPARVDLWKSEVRTLMRALVAAARRIRGNYGNDPYQLDVAQPTLAPRRPPDDLIDHRESERDPAPADDEHGG